MALISFVSVPGVGKMSFDEYFTKYGNGRVVHIDKNTSHVEPLERSFSKTMRNVMTYVNWMFKPSVSY